MTECLKLFWSDLDGSYYLNFDVLRVQPLFYLAEWTVKIPGSVLTKQLRAGIAQGTLVSPLLEILPDPPQDLAALDVKNPRGLEVVFDTQNIDECWVKRRWLTDNKEPLNNSYVEDKTCERGARGVLDDAGGALSRAAQIAGELGPAN